MRSLVILGLLLALAACARADGDAGSPAHPRGLYFGSGAGANVIQ
jgi:hypothetical protein